jgi:pimeloyl-ACP methyl ester carboxylesterase
MAGRPLVFWHAFGAETSGAYPTEVAPTLVDAGLRLIAPDAPGFGESPALPAKRYETAAVVELLGGVLDERGVDRANFMGHSWGGTATPTTRINRAFRTAWTSSATRRRRLLATEPAEILAAWAGRH